MSQDLAELLAKVQEIQADPERFSIYADKPVEFCSEVLGVTLWERQRDVLRAMVDKRRITVRSGHGVGKTFVVACSVIWWLYARKGLVVSTAPTKEHVEGVLWREIRERVKKAPVHLPHEASFLTELRINTEWNAIGLTTDYASAFQGRHHERLLVVVDEAPGVTEQVHLEIATLAVGSKNCILMIGNPTTMSGTFYESFKHPDIWMPLRVSCLDHPNVLTGEEVIKGAVTREWVEQCKREWGESHPLWYSRVLGEFPKMSSKGVIPLGWCERAQNEPERLRALNEAEEKKIPRVGGLDVARYGENQSVLTVRRGDAIEEQIAWKHTTLTETCGLAVRYIKELNLKALVIDANGIGAGVYDRLTELGQPVYGYNGGHRAFTPSTFSNRRGEMWWALRSRLEKQRLWLPKNSETLVGELITPEYDLTSSGRIKIQSKDDLLKNGKKSPDFADSLILCFAMDENPEADLAPVPHPNADQGIKILDQRDEDFTLEQLGEGW